MRDLFTILDDVDIGDLTETEARSEVAGWGTKILKKDLSTSGIAEDSLPNSASILARVLIDLHKTSERDSSSDDPRDLGGLLEGKIFHADDEKLLSRFAVRRDDRVQIWGVKRSETNDLELELELDIPTEQLPPGVVEEVPEWEEGHLDPPDQDDPTGTIELALPTHLRANIKLVYWIPYHPNNEGLRRMLPSTTSWRGATMTQAMRMAARAMLATGNPTPRKSFTKAQWTALVDSKEYRGLLDRDLFMCCPRAQTGTDKELLIKAGYTPGRSGVPVAQLHGDHLDTQSDSSMAGGLLQENIFALPPLPIAGIPDRLENVVGEIRTRGTQSNESFSQGQHLFSSTPMIKRPHLIAGSWKFHVRVGVIGNLLNYLLTGRTVKYQGGELLWRLNCTTGKLKIQYRHSAIPSQRLYVNNTMVYDYDMLGSNWTKVDQCFGDPSTRSETTSGRRLQGELAASTKSPMNIIAPTHNETLTPGNGCPGAIPTGWINPRSA